MKILCQKQEKTGLLTLVDNNDNTYSIIKHTISPPANENKEFKDINKAISIFRKEKI